MRTTILFRHLLLALVVALALVPATGSASGGPTTTLTGMLNVIHADPPPAPEGSRRVKPRPVFRYFLNDDRRQETELSIASGVLERAGGSYALDGKRVTLTLESGPAAANTAKARVRSIQPIGGLSIAALDPSKPDIRGNQKWVVLMCRFSDSPEDSQPTREYLTNTLRNERPGLDHYWREVSYNAIDLAGSEVHDWKDLPQPRSHYHPTVDGAEESKLGWLREDCTAAHSEVRLRDFQGIAMVFNQRLDGEAEGGGNGYGDRYEMTLQNESHTWGYAWIGAPRTDDMDHFAHEMGHGFGIVHSSGPYTETYDSGWDVMSDGQDHYDDGELRADFPFGAIPTHTIAAHKDFLGWIPAARKFTLGAGKKAQITLARLAQPPNTSQPLMAQIPIQGSSTQFYTVELRQNLERWDPQKRLDLKTSYDDGIPAGSGIAVVLHRVDYSRDDRHAQVVDVDGNLDPNDDGAAFEAGQEFIDPFNGVSIAVHSIDKSAGTAAITVDNTPRLTIGDVTVNEPTSSATSQARFTVTLSNASSQAIGLDYITSAGSATKDVDYTHVPQTHLSIPVGAKSATITVNVKQDFVNESNETFFLNLKNPIGVILSDAQAKGTIVNRAPVIPTPTPVPCPSPFVNCQEP